MMHSELISSTNQLMDESLRNSSNHDDNNYTTKSPNQSNGEFPILPTSTYEDGEDLNQTQISNGSSTSASSTWDYDNYIEKPRGHVAQPHYLGSIKSEPEDNSYYSAAPSKGFISQDNNNNTRNIEEGYNNVSDIIAPSSLRLSPALLAVLCYFFGTFGGFIIMILEKKNLFVIFHGWQSFACGVIAFIFQLLFIFSSTMYRLLWIVYLIFTFVMIIKVISDAPTQRLTKVPVIGDWCEHKALNKIHHHTGSGMFYRMRDSNQPSGRDNFFGFGSSS